MKSILDIYSIMENRGEIDNVPSISSYQIAKYLGTTEKKIISNFKKHKDYFKEFLDYVHVDVCHSNIICKKNQHELWREVPTVDPEMDISKVKSITMYNLIGFHKHSFYINTWESWRIYRSFYSDAQFKEMNDNPDMQKILLKKKSESEKPEKISFAEIAESIRKSREDLSE